MSEFSAKKLKQTQSVVNGDSNFRHLGNVDVRMGVKVGRLMYLIVFEGFSCDTIRKISAKEVRDTDFVIDMSSAQWDQFIAGCRSGVGQNLAQLDDSDNIVKTADPRKKLEFLRYHTSIQAFFEVYATLEARPA